MISETLFDFEKKPTGQYDKKPEGEAPANTKDRNRSRKFVLLFSLGEWDRRFQEFFFTGTTTTLIGQRRKRMRCKKPKRMDGWNALKLKFSQWGRRASDEKMFSRIY